MNGLLKIAGDLHDMYQMHLDNADMAIDHTVNSSLFSPMGIDEELDPDYIEDQIRSAIDDHDEHLRKAYLIHGRIVAKTGLPEHYDHSESLHELEVGQQMVHRAKSHNPNSLGNRIRYSAISLVSSAKAERDQMERAQHALELAKHGQKLIDKHEANVKLFQSV